MIQRIEVELDERGFLKLASDGLMPKGKFALEVVSELSYIPFGPKYQNFTPQERAAEFKETLNKWRQKYPQSIGLTDEQLRREYIYED